MTAVSLVDLRRQKAMVTGDTSSATAVDMAPTHPVTEYSAVGLACVAVHEDAVSNEDFLDPRLSIVNHKESLYKFVR